MSDKSTIYEITKLMGNKEVLQNDLNEALNIVKDVFYKKYIQKFQDVLNEHREMAKQQSSKEAQLLMALKPFVSESSHESIDRIIDVMYTITTAQSIDEEIKKCSTSDTVESEDNSIRAASISIVHEDGIYEMDENCLNNSNHSTNSTNMNMTEMIFMLLIFGIIK